MCLNKNGRHKLYNALLQEKFGIQALMSFFQNSTDISKEDIEQYSQLEDSIVNTLRSVSDILRDEFDKA